MLAANAYTCFAGLVRSFCIARTLAPAEFGIWNVATVVLNYANFVDLGLNSGALLAASKRLASGTTDQVNQVLRHAFTSILIVSGLISVTIIIFSFAFQHRYSGLLKWVGCAGIVVGVMNYYQVVARIQDNFRLISIATVLTASISLLGVFIVSQHVIENRVNFLIAAVLTSYCFSAVLLGIATKASLVWRVDLRLIWSLFRQGVPMTMIPIGFTVFQTADRWIVAAMVETQELGYYGFGATIGNVLYMIPNTLAVVLFTKQVSRFEAEGCSLAAQDLVVRPLYFGTYLTVLCGGIALISLPTIVHYFLPAYKDAEGAWLAQIVGNCLLFSAPLATNFLFSRGKVKLVFCSLLVFTIIEVGLVAGCLLVRLKVEAAAAAVALTDMLYGAWLTLAVLRTMRGRSVIRVFEVGALFSPSIICFTIAAAVSRLHNGTTGVPYMDLLTTGVWILAYTVLSIGVCRLCEWRFATLGNCKVENR